MMSVLYMPAARGARAEQLSPWSSHTKAANKWHIFNAVLTTKRCFSILDSFKKGSFKIALSHSKGDDATTAARPHHEDETIYTSFRWWESVGQLPWRLAAWHVVMCESNDDGKWRVLSDAKRASQILDWRKRRKLCVFLVLFLTLTIFLFFTFLSLRLFVNVFLSLLSV